MNVFFLFWCCICSESIVLLVCKGGLMPLLVSLLFDRNEVKGESKLGKINSRANFSTSTLKPFICFKTSPPPKPPLRSSLKFTIDDVFEDVFEFDSKLDFFKPLEARVANANKVLPMCLLFWAGGVWASPFGGCCCLLECIFSSDVFNSSTTTTPPGGDDPSPQFKAILINNFEKISIF